MTGTTRLRAAIVGLIGFAAVEEELLLAEASQAAQETGSPDCWAAVPVVAHNTEFRQQQVTRLEAIRTGQRPPQFAEIDHRSAQAYRGYCQRSAIQAGRESRESAAAMIDGLGVTSDEDLTDPARNEWLNGRLLALQLIVRGFWHPTGHLGDYYARHGRSDRAVALQAQAVATANYLAAPAAARGMAYFNLACAQALTRQNDDAVSSLRQAIELNPDLRANASGDADLAALREAGQLDQLLVR